MQRHDSNPTSANQQAQPQALNPADRPATISEITDNASDRPFHIDDNNDTFDPALVHQTAQPQNQGLPIAPHDDQQLQPAIEEQEGPRRSGRILTPTAKVAAPNNQVPTCLERAVQQSREAAARIQTARIERRRNATGV
ncbi:hypothetical protein C0992_004099 [Termitomyces sp. T32_za158]|nr:hypothetical protein C0992_004099 [Termitomyces sp. T32_za158]